MPRVVLHGLHRSVYTRIAAMALLEKGVGFELEEVEIFGPAGVPPQHLERHPFGRIPVLQCGDFQLYETQAICRYVDEAFEGPRLQPADPAARARMAQTIGVLDSYAYRPMVWEVFVQRVGATLRGQAADDAVIAAAMPKVRTTLSALAGLLGEQAYFGGESPSLADIHAYPMLVLLGLAAEGHAALREQRPLVDWRSRMSARPAAIRTKTQYESGVGRGAA
jgi:glutathione S-transferase